MARFLRVPLRRALPAISACCLTLCLLALAVLWPTARHVSDCVSTVERLMTNAGWRGRPDEFLLRLTRSEDRQLATEACLLPTSKVDVRTEEEALDSRCFAEKLPRSVRQRAMLHLSEVAAQLERVGIEHYLDMGTALGAMRHFEMIPYDEDIDIRINADQKTAAKALLSRLRYTWPQLLFQDTEWSNQHWKVHFTDTMDPVLQRHVALDIFFYRVNRTVGRLEIMEPPFSFPLGDIFPLRRRPFFNRWYFTPNSIDAMISGYFPNTSLADCVYYLHDLPFNLCQRPVAPCDRLRARYTFAETVQVPGGQVQYLVEPMDSVTALAYIAGADRL